ncbi:uncharacterized protein TNCV_89731 [Trichonephila clavipes]|nr:uncharacterized protein TNCV_89731 [Trichonephila clavipes]
MATGSYLTPNYSRSQREILASYVRLFKGAVDSDFLLMDDNARPQRTNLVDDFWKEKISPDGLTNQIYRPQPNEACLGDSGEGSCNSHYPTENHLSHENRVAERVGPNATGTHELLYF